MNICQSTTAYVFDLPSGSSSEWAEQTQSGRGAVQPAVCAAKKHPQLSLGSGEMVPHTHKKNKKQKQTSHIKYVGLPLSYSMERSRDDIFF